MDVRAKLILLIRRLIEAENTASRDQADQILSAQFLGITRADGTEQNRDQLLGAIEKSQRQDSIREFDESAIDIFLETDAAFVRSVVVVRHRGESAAVVGRFRNTHSFRREGTEWHCLGWQVTRLAVPGLASKPLPMASDDVAPDGSDVRVLLAFEEGSRAHFELSPGKVSRAVTHNTVKEIWYVLSGRGEMWRKLNDEEEVVALQPGLCLTLPLGAHFQFRSFGYEALAAIGVTMPAWPGDNEAIVVPGKWNPTVGEQ